MWQSTLPLALVMKVPEKVSCRRLLGIYFQPWKGSLLGDVGTQHVGQDSDIQVHQAKAKDSFLGLRV